MICLWISQINTQTHVCVTLCGILFLQERSRMEKLWEEKLKKQKKNSSNDYCKSKINSMAYSTVHQLSYSLQYDLDPKGYVYDVTIRASHWQQIYTTHLTCTLHAFILWNGPVVPGTINKTIDHRLRCSCTVNIQYYGRWNPPTIHKNLIITSSFAKWTKVYM